MTRALLAILVSMISVSCRTDEPQPDSPVNSTPESFTSLTLDRGACHGICPIYSITVDSSGTVVFNGLRFVKNIGVATRHLAPAERARIVRATEIVSIVKLDPKCCLSGGGVEEPINKFRIRTQKNVLEIPFKDGDVEAITLAALAREIDQVADIDRWIGDEPFRKSKAGEWMDEFERNRPRIAQPQSPGP